MQYLTDDEVLTLLDYPSYFTLIGANLPSSKDSIFERFCEEKFITKTNAHYHVTNLGAILFARNLQEFEKWKWRSKSEEGGGRKV